MKQPNTSGLLAVAVIGLGYVGLSLALEFASAGMTLLTGARCRWREKVSGATIVPSS